MSTADHQSGSATAVADGDNVRYYARKVQRHPIYIKANAAVRAGRHALPELWRQATQRYRSLPGAVIIGAGKAGTTQLYSYLLQHPRCFGGRSKEVHYFSRHHDRPISWYRSQFPLSRRLDRVGGLCVEATPSYLRSEDALRRMSDVLPDAKLIALLRDPVARAFSQYQHEKTRHREERSFLDAARDEITAHERGESLPLRPDGQPTLDYVARGYYATHLESLWNLYPREQVLVIDSADLFADTIAVCERVFDFLELERVEIMAGKVYNRGHYRETIDPAAAEMLREHYRPHDEQLARLMDRPLSWMRPAAAKSRSSTAAVRA